MEAIRAHVRNGKIVLDEPLELPEGEIEANAAEFERGEFEDAHAFALKLVAKS